MLKEVTAFVCLFQNRSGWVSDGRQILFNFPIFRNISATTSIQFFCFYSFLDTPTALLYLWSNLLYGPYDFNISVRYLAQLQVLSR